MALSQDLSSLLVMAVTLSSLIRLHKVGSENKSNVRRSKLNLKKKPSVSGAAFFAFL